MFKFDSLEETKNFYDWILLPETFEKIARLKELIERKNSKALIQIDGGVNLDNAGNLLRTGADVLVMGNALFRADNPAEVIRKIKQM